MHVIVAWNIRQAAAEKSVGGKLKDCLEGYSWARPLPNFYIVGVKDEEAREQIRSAMIDVCKAHPKTVHLVVSPVLSEDGYAGWLPKDMWPKIRKRTGE